MSVVIERRRKASDPQVGTPPKNARLLCRRGVPPSPWQDAAGGVEGGGTGVARHVVDLLGQLDLESGVSVRFETMGP